VSGKLLALSAIVSFWKRLLLVLIAFGLATACARYARAGNESAERPTLTILAYHRFGPKVADSMTVTTATFEWQLGYLRDHGYTVVPLAAVVKFVRGQGQLPPRAVAITVDDGHVTVFTAMRPIIERHHIPVTLFIYPSAISNASYAMTWEQLRAISATGLFTIESHSYWHPNFHVEKRRLSAEAYQVLVRTQLTKSQEVLQSKLGTSVDMLAWPFGLYDDELINLASQCGYVAAFSIDRRNVSPSDNPMALPRYLMTDHDRGKAFEAILAGR
jgi:peptidoglycan/xylan/chitin deacetylase (PgdA/CDA1 family)